MLLLVGDGIGAKGSLISGCRRGIRKSESPRDPWLKDPVRANATATSLSVALENHLKPLSVYRGPRGPSPPAEIAWVSVCDTSEPPGRLENIYGLKIKYVGTRHTSVIHCPDVNAKEESRLQRGMSK